MPQQAGIMESDPTPGSSRSAVSEFRNGLPLPGGAPDGSCSKREPHYVSFGMNTLSSCTVTLTLDGLRRFCRCSNVFLALKCKDESVQNLDRYLRLTNSDMRVCFVATVMRLN